MNQTEEAVGITNRTRGTRGLESLADASSRIASLRVFILQRSGGNRPRFKQRQQFPRDKNYGGISGILDKGILSRLYGERAEAVRKRLVDRGYCDPLEDGRCALSWRFRNLSTEDFDIGLSEKANSEVFQSLNALLWEPLPEGEAVEVFLSDFGGASGKSVQSVYKIAELEYWFLQGLNVTSVRLSEAPSPELISLIDLKLQVIQQEDMQNYFNTASTVNADASAWMNETNRKRRFFHVIETLLTYSWSLFDIDFCELRIQAGGELDRFASGCLRVNFSESGIPSASSDPAKEPGAARPRRDRELVVDNVSLRSADFAGEASNVSLTLVSRSPGSINRTENVLVNQFVCRFIEFVEKLIDIILPAVHRKDALRDLRWRSFLDSHRLHTREFGEDLHRILNESLRLMERFFAISGFRLFAEDREVVHMLDLFARKDSGKIFYTIAAKPCTPAVILSKQLVVLPIREVPGARILLYFELPEVNQRPLDSANPDHYLRRSNLWEAVKEEAAQLGLTALKDYLFFVTTECLSASPKAFLDNISRRLPVRNDVENVERLTKLGWRILDRFSKFFDVVTALSGNMESGLAYMRGRRDNLTGLYNRQHFKSLLNAGFSRPRHRFGIMFIDMDYFKIFNDSVSHDFGDRILSALANRMFAAADTVPNSIPSRFGGDEFCFSVAELDAADFESIAMEVFHDLTEIPLTVKFYLDERVGDPEMSINLLAFLYRLMRPDVGSRQASRTEYVEEMGANPKVQMIDVWEYYRKTEGKAVSDGNTSMASIVNDVSGVIEDKILYNKMFASIDDEFRNAIRLFVSLRLKGYTTDQIRDDMADQFGTNSLIREITLRMSAGLAHSSENRIRSLESLFKAADSRAYLAKHNGRNSLFGINGQRLV